jgi:hypothetical protein
MNTINPRKLFILFLIVAVFAPWPVFAQNSDAGLSGSLEVNHQNYFYKDPNKAFLLAFFPGLLIHGYGSFYADDNIMGNVLLTGEVVSVLSVGLGALIKSDTATFSGGILGSPNNSRTIGDNLIWGGIIAFTGLWIVDMAYAPTAAKDYNRDHGLKPVVSLDHNRPTIAVALNF